MIAESVAAGEHLPPAKHLATASTTEDARSWYALSASVEIERLADLHARNVLTDDEFNASNARILEK